MYFIALAVFEENVLRYCNVPGVAIFFDIFLCLLLWKIFDGNVDIVYSDIKDLGYLTL